MITIKAFSKDEKGLYCQPNDDKTKFYYDVGKTYEMIVKKVKICKLGFHASANCDVSETLNYYPVRGTHYCLVDLEVIDISINKAVGNKITILKELDFKECVEYDKTGKWCYYFARCVEDADVKLLQNRVIEVDKTGEWCYSFAWKVKGADVKLLQNKVMELDKTGEWCYYFALYVKDANTKLLQDRAMELDTTGCLSKLFMDNIIDRRNY